MTSHPDVEALAFFAEELLEPDEERTVASHIDTCATCATTLDELTGVGEVLAAVPVPAMPRDVADLLDQRIAEAARERAAESPAETAGTPAGEASADGAAAVGVPPSGATVIPVSRRRRHKRSPGFMPKLMMVAAAAVLIGGGGAAVLNGGLSDTSEPAGGVAAPLQEDGGEEAAPDIAQSYTPQVVRSGTVYTEASLPEQAALTLDRSPVGGEPSSEDAGPMAAVEDAPVGVEECAVLLGEELGTRFTLVDDASYGDEGSRVWVLFAPLGERYEVYVVDPRCAQGGETAQSVLAQETVRTP
ncbi:anti-sigma factor [Nocardiopsis quinghaiensis]|uniref:hypothetical protein n=1 Tax=Nocardiopsis quinghaiensis TaxID=464995 RepID=UPI001CC24452|nr:hypothetical protein [Nocardiopsis quinghaiensis]